MPACFQFNSDNQDLRGGGLGDLSGSLRLILTESLLARGHLLLGEGLEFGWLGALACLWWGPLGLSSGFDSLLFIASKYEFSGMFLEGVKHRDVIGRQACVRIQAAH